MTKEEYEIKIKKIEDMISDLKYQLKILDEQYIKDNYPFKKGDKIKIITPPKPSGAMGGLSEEKIKYAIIKDFLIMSYSKEIIPLCLKIKNNGTASVLKENIYYNDKIEKID